MFCVRLSGVFGRCISIDYLETNKIFLQLFATVLLTFRPASSSYLQMDIDSMHAFLVSLIGVHVVTIWKVYTIAL